jgi:hypothetical protein
VIFLLASWDTFQSLGKFCDIGTAMRFEEPDDHIYALSLKPMAFLEHLKGFAYSCAVTEVNFQPSALTAADHPEKRIGSIFDHHSSPSKFGPPF